MFIPSEEDYLKEILLTLELSHSNWILGDQDNRFKTLKSADLVNHTLNLAIEVKDDFSEQAPDMEPGVIYQRTRDLNRLSNRYKDDIEDADKKFRNYPDYETAVLIRFNDFSFKSIHYLLGGMVRLTQYNGRIGNKSVNITRHSSNCSLFVFHNLRYREAEFYRNPYSKRGQERIKKEVYKIFPNAKEITQKDLIS